MPTVNVSTTPPSRRPTWVNRCASRSSASAYPLIEPDTSTSSTTRRGRTPTAPPGDLARLAHPPQLTRAACARRRPGRGATAGAGRYGVAAARGRRVANMAESRCFSAADSVATSRCRSTSASLARARTTSSSVLGLARRRRPRSSGRPENAGHAGLRRPRPGQAVAAVEVRREDLVVALEVVGSAAERRPAGEVRRALVVEPERRGRGEEARAPGRGSPAPRPPAARG